MDPKDIIENIEKVEDSHTYKSGLKGAIDETGKALETIGQAVNSALLPVRGMIWGAEKIKDWLNECVTKKLEHVPVNKIIPPNPHIVGPAIEALKFTAQEEELREMFANLIANSINSDTSDNTHPSFVDIIKSMNRNDAVLLRELANNSPSALIDIGINEVKENTVRYAARNVSLLGKDQTGEQPWSSIHSIENLERMGLCSLIKSSELSNKEAYKEIENREYTKRIIEEHTSKSDLVKHIDKGAVEITQFGKMFVSSCIT